MNRDSLQINHDFKVYLPHHREQGGESGVDWVSMFLSILMLVVLVGLICWSFVDGAVKTAENQERYYPTPMAATYQRPAAYRLASPTFDEMEHLHHIARLQEVRR